MWKQETNILSQNNEILSQNNEIAKKQKWITNMLSQNNEILPQNNEIIKNRNGKHASDLIIMRQQKFRNGKQIYYLIITRYYLKITRQQKIETGNKYVISK